ncbi:MAG: trypsin-like peptidase domain-containing protein, partial [Deltaproteobacteria bacterium]|nr:trypsin-like peptidase domain-containing protein [Deltaproteobacteria bacterium]
LDDIILIEGENGKLDVKIDYKFSRFFDPKLDRPGPLLKHLLDTHPDIIHNRPLDLRSDIWSLGKVFIELLTADYNITDYLVKVDELPLTDDAKVLFKTMLANDPLLRLKSMKEVEDSLLKIAKVELETPPKVQVEMAEASERALRRLGRRQKVLLAVVVVLIISVGVAVYNQTTRKKDNAVILEEYANEFAPSVAFLLVDYWLKQGDAYVYRNRSEGTAFLVDEQGYLMTNRHVACPWLEDRNLQAIVMQSKSTGRSLRFGYRLFLWFDGARAFNRSAGFMDSPDLADMYFLESAFRTDGEPKLSIAGVAKPPVQTRQLVSSPLKDDFAVLKIDKIPKGLKPLPLEDKLDVLKVPKLSPIIALGFPLGSRAQEARVNVSVARGHVRRTFGNMIQIDASIYGGNSGGPMIDLSGKVIGIVSGVATDRAPGFLPMVTPLWDMGMVLPINTPIDFLKDLKAGNLKWNGVLDLSVEEKLERIFKPATDARWAEAMAAADKELKTSSDPHLVMAAGIMHFCAGDQPGGKKFFEQSLSMDSENSIARLMLFILDWLNGPASQSPYRNGLVALDWRSPAEFQGYLARVLEGAVDAESALKAWDTAFEKSWINYVVGLTHVKKGELDEAEAVLKEALIAASSSSWEFFLARAQLEQVQREKLSSLQMKERWEAYQNEIEAFQ